MPRCARQNTSTHLDARPFRGALAALSLGAAGLALAVSSFPELTARAAEHPTAELAKTAFAAVHPAAAEPAEIHAPLPSLRSFARRPLELPAADKAPRTAMLTAKEQKKLNGLAKKHTKATNRQLMFEDQLQVAQLQRADALIDLQIAEALDPTTVTEWKLRKVAVQKASRQFKKWDRRVQKLAAKLAKQEALVGKLVVSIETIDPTFFASSTGGGDPDPDPGDGEEPGGGDPGGGGGGDPGDGDGPGDSGDPGSGGDDPGDGDFGNGVPSGSQPANFNQVQLLVHEALPEGGLGADRTATVATFGLPFPQGQLAQSGGRPALSVSGAAAYQARTLDTWGDGSVRWAQIDVSADVPAETVNNSIVVNTTSGNGRSGQANLATTSGSVYRVDTGPLQVDVGIGSAFNLFRKLTVDGEKLIDSANHEGLIGYGLSGESLTPGPSTTVVIEENGPARAVLRAKGVLTTPGGAGVIDFTARMTFRRGSRDVEVTTTLRNATLVRNRHVQIEGLELRLPLTPGSNSPFISASSHTDVQVGQLSGNQKAYYYQAYTSAETFNIDSGDYRPHLPKKSGSNKEFVENGYALRLGNTDLQELGNKYQWAKHPFLNLRGPKGGVTVAIRDLPYLWPGSLEGEADGDVVAGLFTPRNTVPYTFVWRQHESRTALFSFHAGSDPGDAAAVPRRLDFPLVGRAATYDHYDESGVFPYELLTINEHNQAYSLMGISHTVISDNTARKVCRYLGKSTTGGSNNYALVEDQLLGDWLRHGNGGPYLRALDFALWKSEWQVPRSDDFHDDDNPGPINDGLPHTERTFGDEEHRYRDGMILAYHLTGDERFREALFDEAEVLHTINHYQQERSTYQTARAQALVGEFTDDPLLPGILEARMEWFTSRRIDINTENGGWGWQDDADEGGRRYFANSGDLNGEKPAGENFQIRGFFTASLGPLSFYHVARALDGTPMGTEARGRMRDLSYLTRNELFPFKPSPAARHLAYSYALSLQETTIAEKFDFHPILLGMAASYEDTGDEVYLQRGREQVEAFGAHDDGKYDSNLHYMDTRPDCQHFFSVYRDWALDG